MVPILMLVERFYRKFTVRLFTFTSLQMSMKCVGNFDSKPHITAVIDGQRIY